MSLIENDRGITLKIHTSARFDTPAKCIYISVTELVKGRGFPPDYTSFFFIKSSSYSNATRWWRPRIDLEIAGRTQYIPHYRSRYSLRLLTHSTALTRNMVSMSKETPIYLLLKY